MRKGFIPLGLFCIISFFVLFGQVVFASAETIKEFNVDITVNKDSSFLVKESIRYDFGENQRHGIERFVPFSGDQIIQIQFVEDEFGNKYPERTARTGNQISIRIGDPDRLISGEHTYNIFYLVKNGLRFFDDHDELYWNITGTGWTIPIEESSATIHLPERISNQELKQDCFTGPYGSTQKNCFFSMKENADAFFKTNGILNSGEGLTIALGWKKGLVVPPKPLPAWLKFVMAWWPISVPIFSFLFLFIKWWKSGKDPDLKKTIIVQYDPPDKLLPAEVSAIINQRVKPDDFSATIIDFAVRGYLKIKETKTGIIFKHADYELEKLRESDGLNDYEKKVFEKIFALENSVLISKFKTSFYSNFEEFKKTVLEKLTKEKYFISNPGKVRIKYTLIGFAAVVTAVFLIIFISDFILFSWSTERTSSVVIAVVVSAVLFFIFALIMPKRTLKGAEARWHALGFKEYINTAEKYRLQFQEKENIFEKYLPYAISFGLTKKWAKAFEGIYMKPPTWYDGNFGTNFTVVAFADSLNHNISSMSSVAAPQSSGSGLGGGGFSGGGGGGGGGGSW